MALGQSINHSRESQAHASSCLLYKYVRRERKGAERFTPFRIALAPGSCPDELPSCTLAHVLTKSAAASLSARYTKQAAARAAQYEVVGRRGRMRACPLKIHRPWVAHVPQNGEHEKRMKRAQIDTRRSPSVSAIEPHRLQGTYWVPRCMCGNAWKRDKARVRATTTLTLCNLRAPCRCHAAQCQQQKLPLPWKRWRDSPRVRYCVQTVSADCISLCWLAGTRRRKCARPWFARRVRGGFRDLEAWGLAAPGTSPTDSLPGCWYSYCTVLVLLRRVCVFIDSSVIPTTRRR